MWVHCTALALAALLAPPAAAQVAPGAPEPGDASFTIFLRNAQIGREQVTLARTDSGWVITSSGQIGAPVDFAIGRFEMKYAPDWQPLELTLEGRARTGSVALRTSFAMTTAINEITERGTTVAKTDQISARTIVLPNNLFGGYEALGQKLWDAPPGAELPVYIAPQGEIRVKVASMAEQSLTGPAGTLPTRRFELTFQNPGGPLNAIAVIDHHLRLVRFELPGAGFLVVRDDAASVAVRAEIARNPTDADVTIRGNGFNLAGTLTTPPAVAGRLRRPAVLLIGGSSPADRDLVVGGVPIFTQLAGALAGSGHVVLRYDRRGAGQSGGRIETVTLADYADDANAAVRFLTRRDDVDKRRVVVVGYGEGGSVALLATRRNGEIDGIVTIDAPGSAGSDLILRQQERVLDRLRLAPDERQRRIETQKQIVAAVLSGRGWEGIPAPVRRQADTPLFKSVLSFDPAGTIARLKQPMLIVQADMDARMPAEEADRLAEAAKARRKTAPPEVLHLPNANETLAPGGAKTISPRIATAIAEWIKKIG
jgi:pimeloyl-ACP methyl ester carboxylesterase